MAKKENNEKFKTMIGGQALIEGIMMLGPDKCATVVRAKDGIHTKLEPRKPVKKHSPKKIPFVRGVFNFCASMKTGVSALMYSADFYADDTGEEAEAAKPSKLDAWLEKKLSNEKAQSVLITLAVVIGIAFSRCQDGCNDELYIFKSSACFVIICCRRVRKRSQEKVFR